MRISILAISILFVPAAFAKGLKDLAPKSSEQDEAKEGEEGETTPKTITPPEVPADKAVEAGEGKTTPTAQTSGKMILEIDLGLGRISGSKGDWASSFSPGVVAAYNILPLTKKIDLLASYAYSPIDVIVKSNTNQYRGIVETHYLGAAARMSISEAIYVLGSGELGMASAKLDSINSIVPGSEDPEATGVALRFGASAFWKFQDNVGLGGGLNVTLGTFTGWSVMVSTQFSL